jgi:O-acetyl-ADP-ribose deacetylase (regulator of RNase III)
VFSVPSVVGILPFINPALLLIKDSFSGLSIGLPKIGAGLAGGDWKLIVSIIEEELAGEDVTLLEYVP